MERLKNKEREKKEKKKKKKKRKRRKKKSRNALIALNVDIFSIRNLLAQRFTSKDTLVFSIIMDII